MTMEYKGYIGKLDIDPEADLLSGEVLGLRDVITFQGRTPAEAGKAFHESVDDYLEFCKQRGEQPDKPYSGKFMVRVDPATHRLISMQAAAAGASLNAWVNSAIAKQLQNGASSGSPRPSRDARRAPGKARGAKLRVGHLRRTASAPAK